MAIKYLYQWNHGDVGNGNELSVPLSYYGYITVCPQQNEHPAAWLPCVDAAIETSYK